MAVIDAYEDDNSTSANENVDNNNTVNYYDPEYGTYIKARPALMGFDKGTSIDERDHMFHFIVFGDKTKVYAWDPIKRT